MNGLDPEHPLRKLFGGLVEQVFMIDVGLCDPQLTDYVGALLAEFVHTDQIFRLRTIDNEIIRELSRMEAEANLGPDVDETTRRRIIHRYMGDFTLFWTGVYPEQLRPRHQGGLDCLGPYLQIGKRAYGIACELSREADQPPADVLAQLSEQFEYCVHGLHLVRAGWEELAQRHRQN